MGWGGGKTTNKRNRQTCNNYGHEKTWHLWQGERDWAEIITPEQALQEILKSGNMELLEEERFSELKALYEKTIIQEEEVPQK